MHDLMVDVACTAHILCHAIQTASDALCIEIEGIIIKWFLFQHLSSLNWVIKVIKSPRTWGFC